MDAINLMMETQLGEQMVKGPLSGMYIEHDLGRQHMKLLEGALLKVKNGDLDSRVDIIAKSVCYTDLLTRHIEKEDKLIYTFARRALCEADIEAVDESCKKIEMYNEEDAITELSTIRDTSQLQSAQIQNANDDAEQKSG